MQHYVIPHLVHIILFYFIIHPWENLVLNMNVLILQTEQRGPFLRTAYISIRDYSRAIPHKRFW